MSEAPTPIIGAAIDRVDGPLKVAGKATFAAEFAPPRLVHAVLCQATIPSGRVTAIDTGRAGAMPGVLLVLTHRNAPSLPQKGRAAVKPPSGRVMNLLQDDVVNYNGQPIAVVVADTLEHARAAASSLRVTYSRAPAELDFASAKGRAYAPEKAGQLPTDLRWGDAKGAAAGTAVTIDAVYTTPMQTHNPMEPHATIAAWDGDRLDLYDATQYVFGTRETVAKTLGLSEDKVRVLSPFVGGGFGCKGSVWSHVVLAAMAAKKVGRPVKLVLERTQMFGPVGGRPQTEQHLVLAADNEGRLAAVTHEVISHTSQIEDFTEPAAAPTRTLYACANGDTSHRLVKLNVGTPTFQRAPGEATGTFALEVAMDELAYRCKLDPFEVRLRNHAEREPSSGKPWSSKSLRACYDGTRDRFGWVRRTPEPRSMREGRMLVGWGLATATYPVHRQAASASVRLLPDGSAVVRSGTQDLGTGTYTVMTQVAAQTLGLPLARVRFELGDTSMPKAPVSGGSMTVASVSPAVQAACRTARDKLIAACVSDRSSPLYGVAVAEVAIADGWIAARADASRRETVAVAVARTGAPVEATEETKPGDEEKNYAMHSFGAVCAEVRVDPDLGEIRVPRIVGTYAVGHLLNAKTGRSQLQGGIVWGVSMALQEHSMLDARYGRIVNNNLAEYHVPVNADIGVLDVAFVDEDDPHVNPLGVKGIGEIGITGVAAAIANAVYHATGKRQRSLPITLDQLL